MEKPKPKFATKEQLSWFELTKYMPLKKVASMNDEQKLAFWKNLIRDRVEILRHLEFDPEFVKAQFTKLMKEPLSHLGFTRSSNASSTINALTTKRLDAINSIVFFGQNKKFQTVDEAFQDDNAAHIVVNLSAPDEIIRIQFAEWLKEHRNKASGSLQNSYIEKIARWSSNVLLPYYDLCLFCEIFNLKIRKKDIYQLLNPNDKSLSRLDEKTYTGFLRTYEVRAEHVFTEETACVIETLSEGAKSEKKS